MSKPRHCLLHALLLAAACTTAHADEGMWMPSQMPQLAQALQKAGYTGDPSTLADLTAAPLNAVVRAGGGTGAFVSADGLVLTNHHVAFGVIQYNSTPARNLIEQGYVAAGRDAELPANPDFRVRVTVGFDNVTEQVLAGARGRKGRAYQDAVDAAGKRIVAECEREPGIRCSIAAMYSGSDFYRIRQLELRDLRLVYAPPRGIGNYGDEIDNFMWPRHAGDFTLLRAYVDRQGRPAAYAPDNVPYQPPSHLQVARTGPEAGDFAMLAGYPGTTFRHRTAAEFARQVEWTLPVRVDVFDALIGVVEQAGRHDPATRTLYAAQLQSLKNNRKRAAGELEGLRRSDAVRRRAIDERAMLAAAPRSEARDIAALAGVLEQAAAVRERTLLLGLVTSQSQLLRSALHLQRLRHEAGKPDPERESGYQARDLALIEGMLRQVQRRYDPRVEKALLSELLGRYQQLPDAQRLPELDAAFGRDAGALAATLDRVYGSSALGQEQVRLDAFAAAREGKPLPADPLLELAAQLLPAQLQMENAAKASEGEQLRLRPAYMRALAAWRNAQGQALYPDANGTLRISYGRLEPLQPRDAVHYAPLTSVAGIAEKHTGQVPFDAPQPLLDAIAAGDFGHTADPALGTQTVNFLTNLDTTGGNSGSPVLNAAGELIGLNFDSNWEAVSASWWFDPRYKRAIHVDMRYMRWLMEKVYPAPHLLQEMGLDGSSPL